MMPVIRPLHIEEQTCTEYQKEQKRFAEMQTELQDWKVVSLLRRLFRPRA